jgi:hypothetical protein
MRLQLGDHDGIRLCVCTLPLDLDRRSGDEVQEHVVVLVVWFEPGEEVIDGAVEHSVVVDCVIVVAGALRAEVFPVRCARCEPDDLSDLALCLEYLNKALLLSMSAPILGVVGQPLGPEC